MDAAWCIKENEHMSPTVSFLTFNLFSDLPAFRHLDRRLEIAANAIAAERPGIVALQEIVRARACGQMDRKLCELVNRSCEDAAYRIHYAPADGMGESEWKFEEGIALMSLHGHSDRGPEMLKYSSQVRIGASVGSQQYRLPDDRVALHLRYLAAPGIELDAYATHLTDRDEDSGGELIRLQQARELLQWVEQRSDPRNPVLIGGDFNDVPESDTIRALTENGFIDVHAAFSGAPGFTNDRHDLDIEGAEASPNQRIDYVFFRPGPGRNFRIESVRLFLDQPCAEPGGRWLWASDHFGVLARIALD
jgi:endonuclease/exonuclease/phosphatase family metal-dependent hydrolase